MIIKTEPTIVTGPMNKGEAKALTERIRNAVDGLGALVEQAHDRGAWKAMGYARWEDYVKQEFGFTRQRSYQLLDQGRAAKELGEAAGLVSTDVVINEAAARDIKPDLPSVAKDVKARVAKGEEPKKAVKEAVDAKRAEKERQRQEKAATQAKHNRERDEHKAGLSPAIQAQEAAREAAKQRKAKGGEPDPKWLEAFDAAKDRIVELEEAVRVLEKENTILKAQNKIFAEMKVEFDKGGFAEVIAGKDEVIYAQATRIERESTDKVAWKSNSDMWRKRAEESGWSNDAVIDIETGQVLHG